MSEDEYEERYHVRAVGRALDLLAILGAAPRALDLSSLESSVDCMR